MFKLVRHTDKPFPGFKPVFCFVINLQFFFVCVFLTNLYLQSWQFSIHIKHDRISVSAAACITKSRPARSRLTITKSISQIVFSWCSTGEVGKQLQLISSNHVSIRDY